MKEVKLAAILVSLFVLILSSQHLIAQGLFGTITGAVSDSSGAVVSGATIKVTDVDTSVTTLWKTNAAGVYNATSLNPGMYRVEAEMPGFKIAVVNNILLEVNARPKVDLVLSVGKASETVEVTAQNTPMLHTQQTDLGQTIDTRRLEELPTESSSGRSPYSFLTLAPGVTQQFGCSGGCGNEGNVRISGSRPRNDDNILDGTSITPPVFGGQDVGPTVEAIQEFRIEQNSMSAEYGKAGGAIVIQVSKSGTNQFHGSAYEYNRNQTLDARDYFVDPGAPKNPFTYDEFGGSVGGPVVKGKLFFFIDYEAIRSHGTTPNANVRVPDSNFRSGSLSALCSSGFTGPGGICNDQSSPGVYVDQIYNPATGQPVPGNIITSINPIAAKLESVWPTGNTVVSPGIESLTVLEPSTTSINRFNPRIDWNFRQADHLFVAGHTEFGVFYSYGINTGPLGRQTSRAGNYAITIGETHTFNSTTLDDFRFGYTHRIGDSSPLGAGATSPAAFGLVGIPDCLSSVPDTSGGTKCGTPGVSVNGYSNFANGGVLYEPATTFHFSDSISKQVGRHTIKAGAQFDHYAIDNYQPNGVDGAFNFTGNATSNGVAGNGDPFADFLFGVMTGSNSVQVQNAFVSSRAWSYSFFVQDDLKFSSKLTLNLGLRWQYDQSFREIHHGDAFFDPCAISYTGKNPSCVPRWEQFGVNAPDTTFDPSKHQFEPRIGIAWNPLGGFVIRAGYGIMHPGYVGHGRAGDGQPGPNLLATTNFPSRTNLDNLPPITSPSPAAISAPILVNSDVYGASWAPRKQYPTYMQLWNLTVEKQFGSNTVAQIGYVGSKGTHLPINYAYNICQQTPASTAAEANPFDFVGPSTSPYCPAAAAAVTAASGPGTVYCCLSINPGWWGLSSSIYHSMQAQFDHRFSHEFSMLANFTWSKLIDDSSSDWGGFWSLDVLGQDFYNRKAERSVSAGDVPLRFTLAPIVELPFGPGKKWMNRGVPSQIVGGWRVSTIYTIQAGTPFGITDNSYGFCNGAGVLEDRPMMIGNPASISGSRRSTNLWFNNRAFDFSGTCPGPGLVALTGPDDVTKAFGDAPRYFSDVRNPGIDNVDFSLQKDFKIPAGEQTRLVFSADFFNMLNHPEFVEPISDPTAGYTPADPSSGKRGSGFGTIGQTSLPNRTIQLGLHLYF
jgi:hypothetical protein